LEKLLHLFLNIERKLITSRNEEDLKKTLKTLKEKFENAYYLEEYVKDDFRMIKLKYRDWLIKSVAEVDILGLKMQKLSKMRIFIAKKKSLPKKFKKYEERVNLLPLLNS
jgi:hypothetical protein